MTAAEKREMRQARRTAQKKARKVLQGPNSMGLFSTTNQLRAAARVAADRAFRLARHNVALRNEGHHG